MEIEIKATLLIFIIRNNQLQLILEKDKLNGKLPSRLPSLVLTYYDILEEAVRLKAIDVTGANDYDVYIQVADVRAALPNKIEIAYFVGIRGDAVTKVNLELTPALQCTDPLIIETLRAFIHIMWPIHRVVLSPLQVCLFPRKINTHYYSAILRACGIEPEQNAVKTNLLRLIAAAQMVGYTLEVPRGKLSPATFSSMFPINAIEMRMDKLNG